VSSALESGRSSSLRYGWLCGVATELDLSRACVAVSPSPLIGGFVCGDVASPKSYAFRINFDTAAR
jgi:hypothetical protein